MAVDLNDVTICAADSVNLALTHRALQLSMRQCRFGDAVLFSDQKQEGEYRTVRIAPLDSVAAYSKFIFTQLAQYIETSHVLVVQWDGYVVDSSMWSADFLDYDFIGARWGWPKDGMEVGNGGFSLRSRKLLMALRDPRFQFTGEHNEDLLICRIYRKALESEFGIRFASEAVADRFSHENMEPKIPTFGFHGMRNLWRYVDNAEMLDLLELFSPYIFCTPQSVGLAVNYLQQRNKAMVKALYGRIRAHADEEDIRRAFALLYGTDKRAAKFMRTYERMLRWG